MPIAGKKIVKNTMFLYLRQLCVLLVTLYTSRVVLDVLGADDYGLYYVVYGVIGMLAFLNSTLSTGTSRFLAIALGVGEEKRLKRTFGTTMFAHVVLAIFIIIIAETVGLWYARNVMEVPSGRVSAALTVYQISIVSTVLSIIQVPFSAEIIAHERMDAFAYIGIFDAFAKLAVVFMLQSAYDKLVLYATLLLAVSAIVTSLYVGYCLFSFSESRTLPSFDKPIFSSIMKFSGWNIVANLSQTLLSQGVIMLYNLFFLPVVVASQAIANQVSQAMMSFVNNVRTAVNPQVFKLYADGQASESKRLTLLSAEYIFDLLLLLGLPCLLIMPQLLDLWLVDVPEYAVAFARIVVIQNILGNFSAAFYTPMLAANKLSKNTYASLFLCILQFALLCIMFRNGFGPMWALYLSTISTIVFSFVVKPYILWKDVDYSKKELLACIWACIKVLVLSTALCICIYFLLPQTSLLRSLIVACLAASSVLLSSFMLMKEADKKVLVAIVKRRFFNNTK